MLELVAGLAAGDAEIERLEDAILEFGEGEFVRVGRDVDGLLVAFHDLLVQHGRDVIAGHEVHHEHLHALAAVAFFGHSLEFLPGLRTDGEIAEEIRFRHLRVFFLIRLRFHELEEGQRVGLHPRLGEMVAGIVDWVGYGAASVCSGRVSMGGLTNTLAALRIQGGCKYTPSVTDFSIGSPAPRNSASAPNFCGVK